MWSRERPPSIRRRLTLHLVGIAGALLAALFVALDLLIDRELYSRFDAALIGRTRALAALSGARVPATGRLEDVWPEFGTGRHEDFYQLWDEAGATLVRSPSSGGRELPRPPDPGNGEPLLYDLVLPDGHRGRAVAMTVRVPREPPAAPALRLLVVATEREALDALERRLHASLVIGVLATLGAMVLLAGAAVRRGLAPLAEFGATTARRADDPHAERPVATALPAELTGIAALIDHAFDRLVEALAWERRFARDVAHELRTPLAELAVLLGAVRSRAGDAAQRRELERLDAVVAGMQRSVEGLLALARYEAGLDQPVIEPLEAAALVRQQLDLVRPAARERELAIEETLPAELWVLSDAALLERIVANLLGNAVAHAPPATRVRIALDAPPGVPGRLTVRNDAPALTPAKVERFGERRHRAPAGDVAGGGHAGLGLPLAATLARRLGLTLRFGLAGAELCAELTGLPLLAPG